MKVLPRPAKPCVSALAFALLLALGACTTTTTTPSGEIKTASDTTDAEKRARVRLELALSYFERGQNETALDEVKQALVVDPRLGPAYNLRGLVYASMGEVRLAEENFQRALQINNRDSDAMHNYGWFLCQQGRYAESHVQFEAALNTPNYREVPRTLLAQGVCFGREKRWEQAEASLTRAYSFDADNPVVGYNLSDVLYRRGEYERARFFVRRINQGSEYSNAQTLWLAIRIENRIGNRTGVTTIGQELRSRYPQSREAAAYERGRFDE